MSPKKRPLAVVKVGTHVVADGGSVDHQAIGRLAEQIADIRRSGLNVVLVSSGAVGAGRGVHGSLRGKPDEVSSRQVLAAIGQVELMQTWRDAFRKHTITSAQVLATRSDFRDRRHYLNMQRCLQALLDQDVIPIVNENDVVSVTELMFTDNDQLAGLVAGMVDARSLLLLSNVDGVLDEQQRVISTWTETSTIAETRTTARSRFGRGGMLTKLKIAQRCAKLGIDTWIANGGRDGIMAEVLINGRGGTRFPASRRKSSAKRWVATSGGQEKGTLTINEGACEALLDTNKLASLLPVGIVRIDGTFERGDILRIASEANQTVGYGRAEYGAASARRRLGKRGGRALIHYDYLFIESA